MIIFTIVAFVCSGAFHGPSPHSPAQPPSIVRGESFVNARSTLHQGTNDHVALGEPANLKPNLSNTEFTISFWFRTSTLATQQYIVAHATPFSDPVSLNYVVGVNTNGSLFAYFGSSGKTTQSSASAIAINTWYHVGYTVRNVTGTFTANLWLETVKTGSDVTAPGTDVTAGVDARIGAGYVLDNPDTALPFTGNVDEVTFWSVGFTSTEIAEIYNGGHPGNALLHSRAASLIHYYRMGDDDSFPTIDDKAGSSDGTCTNMAGASTNFVAAVP